MVIIMGSFGHFIVNMYLNNTFNSFLHFSASDWYNKIPISLFQRPKTPNSKISWFLNPSPQIQHYLFLETPWHLQNIIEIPGTCLAHIILENMRINIFEKWNMRVPNFLNVWNFEIWNFETYPHSHITT